MYISREDVLKHPGTIGCPGCRAGMQEGARAVGHSHICRRRFEKLLMETAGEKMARTGRRREGEGGDQDGGIVDAGLPQGVH